MASYPFTILARSKNKSRNFLASEAIGQTALSVDTGSNSFAAGEHVFCAESDGSVVEYLGTVQGTPTGNVVNVEFALENARTTGSVIWVASQAVIVTRHPKGLQHDRNFGTNTTISQGGTVFATNVADEVRTLEYNWPQGAPTDWEAIMTFIALPEAANGGLSLVSLGWYDHAAGRTRVSIVRIDMSRTAGLNMRGARQFGSFALRFIIDTLDGYQV